MDKLKLISQRTVIPDPLAGSLQADSNIICDVCIEYAEDIREPDFNSAKSAWESLERIGVEPGNIIIEGLGNEIHQYPIKILEVKQQVVGVQSLTGESFVLQERLMSYRLVKDGSGTRYVESGMEEVRSEGPGSAMVMAEKPSSLVSSRQKDGRNIIYIAAVMKKTQGALVEQQMPEIESQATEDQSNGFLGKDISRFLTGTKKAA